MTNNRNSNFIKIKLPIGADERGSLKFEEWEKEYSPFQPLSFYMPNELKGILANRIIVSGKSYPHLSESELLKCDPLSEEETNDLLNFIVPKENDEIIFIPGIGDFGIGEAIAAISAFMAAHAVWAFIIKMVIMIAISSLLSLLTAPAKPKGQQQENSPTSYGWQGAQNSYGGGDAVPVPFGRHRVGVKVIYYSVDEEYVKAKPGKKYEFDLTRTRMFLNMLGILGHGEVNSITDVRLNDNPIANYGSDVELYTKNGTQDQEAIPGFDTIETAYQIGSELPYTPCWTSGANIVQGEYVVPTDKTSPAFMGYIYICWTTDTYAQWQADGKTNPAGTTGNHEPTWPTVDGALIHDGTVTWMCQYDNRYQYTTTEGIPITSYKVHLEAPQGLYFSNDSGIGYNDTTIKIEDRVHVDSNNPYSGGVWTDRGEYLAAAGRASVARWAVLVDGLASGRYDIRVTQIHCRKAQQDFSSGTKSAATTVQISKITEIEEVSPQTYAGYAVVGIRALATSTLSDSAPTLTALVEGVKVPVWDGSEWVTQWSQNPLYIAREIMLNTTWGFGNWVTSDYIDDASLIAAAAHCDEQVNGLARHTFNLVWDQRRKMFPMLMDVLGPARVMLFYGGGKFRFVHDSPRNSTQLFTTGNIIKDSLVVEWIDELKDYNAYDCSILYDCLNYQTFPFRMDLGISPVKPKNITLTGVTDLAEARRDCSYQLNISSLLHEAITFHAGIDSIVSLPGDVISFSDDIMKASIFSGRVAQDSTSLTAISLTDTVSLAYGKTYQVIVRYSADENADAFETRTVTNSPGAYTTLNVSSPFSQLPKKYDLCVVGELTQVTKDYILLEVIRKNNFVRELHALEFNANVYNDSSSTTGDSTVVDVVPQNVPPDQIVSCNVTEEQQIRDDFTVTYNMHLNWPKPVRSAAMGLYEGAHLYFAQPDLTYIISDFQGSDWSGGTPNTIQAQFKDGSQSYQLTSVNAVWQWAVNMLGTSLDFSPSTYGKVGLWVYIDNVANISEIDIRLRTDSLNYFYYQVLQANLTSGWNFILIDKNNDFSSFGSPAWSNINSYQLGLLSQASATINASFNLFYFYTNFNWVYKCAVVGTSYIWPNALRSETHLFKLCAYSPTNIENTVNPAYAGITITPFDTVAPAVPAGLSLSVEGFIITAQVNPNSETDFAYYKWHIKKTASEFTPDSTTFYKVGPSNTCLFNITDIGIWSVKVLAGDSSGNESAFCSALTIQVTGQIPIGRSLVKTPVESVVPSSFYLNLKVYNKDTANIFSWADWLTLHDDSWPWNTIGMSISAIGDPVNALAKQSVTNNINLTNRSAGKVPSSVIDDGGSYPWSTLTCTAMDDNGAKSAQAGTYTSDGSGNVNANPLLCSGFDFSDIPASATILGIKVEARRRAVGGNVGGSFMQIGSASTGSSSASRTDYNQWGLSFAMVTYGDCQDLWNKSWTVAEMQNGFWVVFYPILQGGYGEVDVVRVTVYYSGSQTNGPLYGSTFTNNSTVGTVDWTNPGNAQLSDGNYAYSTLGAGASSHYLKATGFGFAIPASASILGIGVSIQRMSYSGGAGANDNSLKLVKGGTIQGTDHASGTLWPTSEGWASYGGGTDLWGLSLSPSDVNASNFGVAIAGVNNLGISDTIYIDQILITVYYILGSAIVPDGSNQAAAFNSQWCDLYIIYNSTTKEVASLSTNDSGVSIIGGSLPPGFDYYVRIASFYVDGSGHIVSFHQRNERVYMETVVINGINPTTASVWQAVDVSAAAPKTAKEIFGFYGMCLNPGGDRGFAVAQDINGTHEVISCMSVVGYVAAYCPVAAMWYFVPVETAYATNRALYWKCSNKDNSSYMKVMGYVNNI